MCISVCKCTRVLNNGFKHESANQKKRTGTISFQNSSTVVRWRVFQKLIQSSVARKNSKKWALEWLVRIKETFGHVGQPMCPSCLLFWPKSWISDFWITLHTAVKQGWTSCCSLVESSKRAAIIVALLWHSWWMFLRISKNVYIWTRMLYFLLYRLADFAQFFTFLVLKVVTQFKMQGLDCAVVHRQYNHGKCTVYYY